MKKFIISFNLIILTTFFTVSPSYCEDAFFTGVPFEDTVNKTKFPPQEQIKEQTKETKQEKKGFFSSLFSKKDKTFNYSTNKQEEVPKGYYGSLPNVEEAFKYKRQNAPTIKDNSKIPDNDDLKDENLKQAPFDDALFLDNIIKKDKTSNYVNDLQRTKFALNNLKKCIEDDGDIQRFNACVNLVDLYVKNLMTKYENTSDSLKESYKDILLTNYSAKVVGNLLYDSNYYAKYIPTQQSKYSKDNILIQKKELLNKINKTLFLIANES